MKRLSRWVNCPASFPAIVANLDTNCREVGCLLLARMGLYWTHIKAFYQAQECED